jgi:NADH dehydrogenase
VLRAAGRSRPLVSVPAAVVRRALRLAETLLGARAPATPDEVDLLEVSMTSTAGDAGAQGLGVTPRAMAAVLGAPA